MSGRIFERILQLVSVVNATGVAVASTHRVVYTPCDRQSGAAIFPRVAGNGKCVEILHGQSVRLCVVVHSAVHIAIDRQVPAALERGIVHRHFARIAKELFKLRAIGERLRANAAHRVRQRHFGYRRVSVECPRSHRFQRLRVRCADT